MICPNNFAKEVARASGRKMPNVSDELLKNGFDSVKKAGEIKRINKHKFSSDKIENDNLNSLHNSSDEMLQMAADAGEYEKVFKNIKESAKSNVELKNEPFSELRANTYKFLKSIQGKTLTNKQSNIKAYVNSDGAKKMVSDAAIEKSKNNGYNAREHLSVANKINELFENANFVNEIADKNGHESIKRLNFEAPVIVGENKAVALITAKKSIDKDLNTIYSLELQEIKQADIRGGKAQTAQKQVINEKMTHALPKTSADKQAFIVKNSTTTANKSQEVNIRPIKEFGTNYAEFYHDGANAIKKLLTERQGQVAGAFEREELGDIDLVWGEVTDAIKHKGYGLSHILDKRMAQFMEQGLSKEQAEAKAIELINKLPDIIKNGKVRDLGNGKVRIVTENYSVGMKKEWKGQEKNPYILTAFENTKESAKNLHSNTFTKGETLPLNSSENSTTTANKSQEVNLSRAVVGDIQSKAPTTAVGSKNGLALRERIITFDSDRNLNEPMNFKNPNLNQLEWKGQELNIQPIKEFGTNYAEFYHDGANAIKKLLTERQGQVAGAFEREELGDIDLVWGEVTDAIKHKGYGLSHILDKRMAQFMEQGLSKEQAEAKAIELINKLPDIIKNGNLIRDDKGRLRIEFDNFIVGIKDNWKGKPTNKWIVTSYIKKENGESLYTSSPITKGETLPLNSKPNSTTTANKSQENNLKGVDGKEYPNTIAGRWEKRVDEAFDWAYKNIYAKGVKSGIKGAEFAGRAFSSQETGAKIQRGLEKTFALQDEIGALNRLKSAYLRNSAVARVEAMKVYESLVKLEIDERVALFRMLDGQEVESNLAGKLRPTYQKLRDKIDERAELLIKLGMLKGQNAKENYIKYSYSQYYDKKDVASKGFSIGKLKARNEDLSYEDRVKLGLIEDGAIAVTQTLNSQNNQIQKAILLKSLADEYAIDQPKDGYTLIPDESVGGGVKKYGALAGKYVPSAIYDDLQNAGVVSSIFDAIRPYTDIIDHIKVNLTVKNPATHGYNVLSNSVLAFLHGDTKANLDLIKLLATNKKEFDELLAKAEAMGLDTASDDIEMRNLLMANDEIAKEATKNQNPLGYYIAKAWQNIYLTQNSTTGKIARKAYEWEDKWFKLARFKKNLDAGLSDEAAFSDANSAYVDYSSHFNPTLRLLDKTGVLPFFHFAVKSSIVVTKAAIKNPAKFAMLQAALISSGASSLPYWFDSEQKDADNSRLPDWAASNYLPNLFGVKNQVQVGESGLYFNAARAMAGFRLSSIDDITGGGGLVGGLLDILRGRDSWGNEMAREHDPAIKQLTARLDAFSKQFLPSITLGRYGRQGLAIATGNNPKNAYNEPMGLGELAGRFVGLRMINEKKELRSAAINAKNRYKKAKDKEDVGAMAVALNDYEACRAAASDMGVSLEALIKMRSKDIK